MLIGISKKFLLEMKRTAFDLTTTSISAESIITT